MKRIAITGNQGSGKSFITREFSKLGVPTLMMDDVAKEIQFTNKDLISELSKRFPEGYPNGVLDKMKMREILFTDKTGQNKKDISIIIRPYLFNELFNFFQRNEDKKYIIVESALLYEYKIENMFDEVIFVHSDPQLRKEKAIKRDNITEQEYNNRMKDQLPDEFKLKKANYVITNDFTPNVVNQILNIDNILNK